MGILSITKEGDWQISDARSLSSADTTDGPSPSEKLEDEQPPDGGLQAWTLVLGSFLLMFNFWGLANTYGGFRQYYETFLLPDKLSSALTWPGTLQGFFLVGGGVLSGPLFDRGFLNTLVLAGSGLFVFGVMMLSMATEYYQVILAQGVCVGIGSACLYAPSLAVPATAFTTKRSLALGIATAGSAIVAFFCLHARKVRTSGKPRRLLDYTALRDPPFMMFSIGLFFIYTAYSIPFFYLPSFSLQELHTSRDMAYYMLAICNGASFFGRVLPSLIADRFGAIETLFIGTICAAVLCFAWAGVNSVAGFVIWSVLWGFFAGLISSIFPAVVPALAPRLAVVGTWMGMPLGIESIGVLIGSPIASAIAGPKVTSYLGLQLFSGLTMLFGALSLLVPWRHIGRKKRRASRAR